jgi:hypothetical protein
VNESFHGATLPDPTLSKREANHFLHSGAQNLSSSRLKVGDAMIHALAVLRHSCKNRLPHESPDC